MKVTKSPVYTAIKMATLTPARLLGLDDKKGSIEVGKEADLVLLDQEMNCVYNFVR